MKFTEITFHQLFATGSFENQRLEVKGTLEEGETLCQAFLKAKQGIIESFKFINNKDNNPQLTEGEKDIYDGERISNYLADEAGQWAKPTPFATWDKNAELRFTPPPLKSIDRKAIERLEILIDDAKTDEELMPLVDEIKRLGLQKQYYDKLEKLRPELFQPFIPEGQKPIN